MFYVSSKVGSNMVSVRFDGNDGKPKTVAIFNSTENNQADAETLQNLLNGLAKQSNPQLLEDALAKGECDATTTRDAMAVWRLQDKRNQEQAPTLPMTIGDAIKALIDLASDENGAVDLQSPLLIGLPDESFSEAECSVTAFRIAWVPGRPTGPAAVVIEPRQSEEGNGGWDSGWRLVEGQYRLRKA